MRTLPDYLRKGMKLIIVGCNPGERSARVGHYYAGRGNQFWPLLYESGVVPEMLSYNDDKRLVEFGVGLTDLVKRPTKSMEEIERQEFAEGRVARGRFQWQGRLRTLFWPGMQAWTSKRNTLWSARICPSLDERPECWIGARREDALFQEAFGTFEEFERLTERRSAEATRWQKQQRRLAQTF